MQFALTINDLILGRVVLCTGWHKLEVCLQQQVELDTLSHQHTGYISIGLLLKSLTEKNRVSLLKTTRASLSKH